MKKKELTGKDVLLMLLYSPGITKQVNEPVIGKTRITKMIFIFEKELLKIFDNVEGKSMPEFFSYNYGPFSKELYDDLKFFKTIGLVAEEETQSELSDAEEDELNYWASEYEDEKTEEQYYECKYYLTDNGIKYVEDKLLSKLTEPQKKLIEEFKQRINSLTLDMLLRYVYNKYEDYTDKSKIRKRYL